MPRPKKETYGEYGLNDDELKKIRRKIHACVKYAEKEYEKDQEALRNYYKGEQWDETPGSSLPDGDHRIVVNRLLPNIEIKVDAVAFNKPEFIFTASSLVSKERIPVAKSGLNYYWRTEEYQDQAKRAFKDAKIQRYGAVHIGWRFETGDAILDDKRAFTEGDLPDPQAMAEAVAEGIDPTQPIPRDAVVKDAPAVRRIKPYDLMLEPGADDDLEMARYVVWRECLPLEEVKANPRLKNVNKLKGKDLYGEELLDDDTAKTDSQQRPDDCKRVELLHFYERRRRLHCIYDGAGEVQEPLLVEEWPWDYKGYPFALTVAHSIPDEPPGKCVSDVDLAHPVQQSLNQTRSLQQNHLEQYSAKFQTRTGNLSPQARRQLKSTKRFTVVEHQGSQDQAIVPIVAPNVSQDVYQVEQLCMRDMDYLLGVSDFQRNQPLQGGRKTATEVAAVQQTGNSRVDSDTVRFTKFIQDIARKVLALLKQYHYHTISIPIYDEATNLETWVEFSAAEIAGEYDLEVEVGSTEAVNKEAEKQNAIFLLQTLTPFLQMTDPLTMQPIINPIPLIKTIVELSGVKNANEIVVPPPPMPLMPGMPGAQAGAPGVAAPGPEMGGAGGAGPQQQLASLFGGIG